MIKEKSTYKVGIYARISKDNGCAEISESIENQKESLKHYADSRRWSVIKYYVDRGYSGTNFERPALQEMLADAKEGFIDLILVKDLSRIGRNHLLVGALIETILPEMECRFIALNNHIDTLDHDSPQMDYVGFVNLFNEKEWEIFFTLNHTIPDIN